jgi:membrane-bound metal-dependent hydrolase YbcI (DUF457 family)
LLLGLEHVRIEPGNTAFTPYNFYDYPISHSLLTTVGWSAMVGLFYFAVSNYRRGAWIVAAAVFSHWLLDFVSHRPDMPLTPGNTAYVGLGLWNSVVATVVIEGAMFAVALWWYVRFTKPADRIGRYAFWILIVLVLVGYAGSIAGQPPGSVTMVGIGGLAQWLIVPWAYWIDGHREWHPES